MDFSETAGERRRRILGKRSRQKLQKLGRRAERRQRRAAAEEAEVRAARERLEPLAALLEQGGPLASLALDPARVLALVSPERPSRNEDEALVRMWSDAAPALTDPAWRRAAREVLRSLMAELPRARTDPHPDLVALEEAHFWLDDALASGAASLENALLQFLFDLACERAFLEGRLPSWLASAYRFEDDALVRAHAERRHARAIQRIVVGPMRQLLPAEMLPSLGAALATLHGDELDPDALAAAASEAADRDLTPERRLEAAIAIHRASEEAQQVGKPLLAFDLRAIAAALIDGGPASNRIARLLYARAVDAALGGGEGE